MSPMLWTVLVPISLAGSWLLIRKPIREVWEEIHLERARKQFHLRREGLEARFVTAVGRIEVVEKLRWDEASWRDEVVWARDRKSRYLMAMVGVTFDSEPFGNFLTPFPKHATAIFEYRRGKWHAEGKRLDQTLPSETFLHNQRFEPVITRHRRV